MRERSSGHKQFIICLNLSIQIIKKAFHWMLEVCTVLTSKSFLFCMSCLSVCFGKSQKWLDRYWRDFHWHTDYDIWSNFSYYLVFPHQFLNHTSGNCMLRITQFLKSPPGSSSTIFSLHQYLSILTLSPPGIWPLENSSRWTQLGRCDLWSQNHPREEDSGRSGLLARDSSPGGREQERFQRGTYI